MQSSVDVRPTVPPPPVCLKPVTTEGPESEDDLAITEDNSRLSSTVAVTLFKKKSSLSGFKNTLELTVTRIFSREILQL